MKNIKKKLEIKTVYVFICLPRVDYCIINLVDYVTHWFFGVILLSARSAATWSWSLFGFLFSLWRDWIMSGYTGSFSRLNISKNNSPSSAVTVNGIGGDDNYYKDNNNKNFGGDMLIEWEMSSLVSAFFSPFGRFRPKCGVHLSILAAISKQNWTFSD